MKNLKELASFGIEMAKTYDVAMLDGKFQLTDLMLFIPVIMKSHEAFKDIKQISEEWKNSSFEQKQMFAKEVEQEFDIKNDKAEAIIESSILVLLHLDKLISSIKG